MAIALMGDMTLKGCDERKRRAWKRTLGPTGVEGVYLARLPCNSLIIKQFRLTKTAPVGSAERGCDHLLLGRGTVRGQRVPHDLDGCVRVLQLRVELLVAHLTQEFQGRRR